MNDVIKEYLVSLGFDIDSSSYNQFTKVMNNSELIVDSFAGTTVSSMITAGAAVVSFVATAVAGITKLIDSTAEADLEYRKFARQMWTSTEVAKEVKMSLDAMGASMEDLWLSPELLHQFRELRGITSSLQPPKEFAKQMQYIRSIRFELTKFRLEMRMASQWVVYYLVKYLDKPLASLQKNLKEVNEAVTKNMPHWTKRLAQVLSWAIRLGVTISRVIYEVLRALQRIPNVVKAVLAALASLGAVAMMNPFTIIIMSITLLLLLLDDFFTYLDGGESALGDFWSKLEGFSKQEAFQGLLKSLDLVDESVGDLFDSVMKLGSSIKDAIGEDAVNSVQDALIGLANFLTIVLNVALKTTAGYLEAIADSIDYLSDTFQGGLFDGLGKMKEDLAALLGYDPNSPKPRNSPILSDSIVQSTYPQGNRMKQEVNVTSAPTFNMYGTDAYLVSNNVLRQQDSLLMRNLQGVMR